MYRKTEEDYEIIFQVADPKISGLKTWEERAEKLNEYFNVNLTPKQWRIQRDSGKRRIRKYGSPATRVKSVVKLPETPKDKFTLDQQKSQLQKYLIRPKTLDQMVKHLDISKVEALGLIQMLKLENYLVKYDPTTEKFSMDRKVAATGAEYRHIVGDVKEFEFLVISDSHWNSKVQQKSFVEYIYDEAERRGITNVYHCGDISDGYYKRRPEQIYELFNIGADDQKDYIIENWPKRKGIKTFLIIGNHDETHIKNGGFNIGNAIAKEREDIEYLGVGHAKIWLTENCRMDVFHPLDGSSYAVSYSGQKYMDGLTGGDKPNLLFVGHHHKCLYFPYRNIHYFEVPSMCKQSSWMKRKRIANASGAWFVKVKVDEEGTLVSVLPEQVKQYKFLENDY